MERRWWCLILGVVVVVGLVWTRDAASQQIFACVQQGSLHVRIVGNPSDCRGPEAAVSWNVVGPQGPAGPAGPQGPQGIPGPQGVPGPVGIPLPVAITVNCDAGQSITQALQTVSGAPLTVTVLGTCTENVVIARDGVTLVASPPSGGTISSADPTQNAITIDGVRIAINGLTVTGGRNGIRVQGSATIENTIVQNAASNGIFFYNGQGVVDGCTIQNNSSSGVAVEGGNVTLTGNTISHNGIGVRLLLASSARIGLSTTNEYIGNTISDNGMSGVYIGFGASAFLGGNTISSNGENGVNVLGASAALYGKNRMTANGGSGLYLWASHVMVERPFTKGGENLADFIDMIDSNRGVDPNTAGVILAFDASLEVKGNLTIINNTGDGLNVTRRSIARLRAASPAIISNNTVAGISLRRGGTINLQTGPTATGNSIGLLCSDGESSYDGITTGIQSVDSRCTGF